MADSSRRTFQTLNLGDMILHRFDANEIMARKMYYTCPRCAGSVVAKYSRLESDNAAVSYTLLRTAQQVEKHAAPPCVNTEELKMSGSKIDTSKETYGSGEERGMAVTSSKV
jgi:hypothetical protein